TEIAFPLTRAADAVDELAVHRELDRAVDGHDVVDVPFTAWLAAVLDRHAPFAPRILGHDLHDIDAEELAMHVAQRRSDSVSLVQVDPVQFEHLDLDAVRQAAARIGDGTAPGEDARVSSRLHVHPLDVEDEVLILLRAPHHADRVTGTDQEAVL